MNTPGTNKSQIIVGDADGLIALLHTDDVNHAVAEQAARQLIAQQADVLFPLTATLTPYFQAASVHILIDSPGMLYQKIRCLLAVE